MYYFLNKLKFRKHKYFSFLYQLVYNRHIFLFLTPIVSLIYSVIWLIDVYGLYHSNNNKDCCRAFLSWNRRCLFDKLDLSLPGFELWPSQCRVMLQKWKRQLVAFWRRFFLRTSKLLNEIMSVPRSIYV